MSRIKTSLVVLLVLAIVGSIVLVTWQPETEPNKPTTAERFDQILDRLEEQVRRVELIVDGTRTEQ